MKDVVLKLDQQARTLAGDYLRIERELLPILIEMRRKRAFAALNYTGIFDYCERGLKFSRANAYYFKTVAEKAEEVPAIRAAIAQGELTLSQARRIVPVVTAENHQQWIQMAKALPQTELERAVTEVNPKAHLREKIRPVAKGLSELRVPVDLETERNLTALKDLLSQKLRRPATLADVVAWMARDCRERLDPEKRAQRRISSGKASTPKPGRHAVPAAVTHEVVLKQGWQCAYVGADGRRCEQKRWLHKHHVQEVAGGGLNTPTNLQLLCSAHHRLAHHALYLTSPSGTRWR